MGITLDDVKNLKIVPKNYTSATVFEINEIKDGKIKINLPKVKENELKDYQKNSLIEAFGIAKHGLIYFTSEILNQKDKELEIKYPNTIKEIQRRKYSRVPFDGNLKIKVDKKIKIKTDDISAGGIKFYSDTPFMVGKEYEVKIELVNNLVVECTIQPIRVEETDEEEISYSISAKYKKIRSIDRIALMQYSLRYISELENKG